MSGKLSPSDGKKMMKRVWELRRGGMGASQAFKQARTEVLGETGKPFKMPSKKQVDENIAKPTPPALRGFMGGVIRFKK